MSTDDQAKEDERAAEKAAREAAWWAHWREQDFSWDGLAALRPGGEPKHPWLGWSASPDGRCIETVKAPKGSRPATQQDYLRWDSATGRLRTDEDLGGLLVKDKGQAVFHILHLPPTHSDGTPSFKADLKAKDWQTLEAEVDRLIQLGGETDAAVGKAEFKGADNRTQLSGAILCRFPRPPTPEDKNSEPAMLHLAANFSAWLDNVDASTLEFGSSLWMHAAAFLGDANFRNAQFSGGDADFYHAQFSGGDAYFSEAQFSGGDADFYHAQFSGGDAYFSEAQFSGGDASFTEAQFSGGGAGFREAQFSGGDAYFYQAQFSGGNADFNQAQFSGGDAYFSEAQFSGGDAYFYHAQFSGGDAYFSEAQFSGGDASFNQAQFSGGGAGFREAQFSGGDAYFRQAQFSGGDANFLNAQFSGGNAYFTEAQFSGGDANFYQAQFSGGNANFYHAQFSGGNADFNQAQFSGGDAYFSEAQFSGGDASFNQAQFSGGGAGFREAQFSGGDAYFRQAQFSGGDANFLNAQFSGGNAYFTEAQFSGGDANFYQAQFSGGNANFYHAQFSGGNADFWGTIFGLQRLLPGDLGLPRETAFWIHGSRDARFDQAEFTHGATFLAARFLGEASFRSARFAQSCEFGRADQHRSGSEVRPGAAFQHRLSLRGASFNGLADFSRVRFPQRAEDRNSAFEGARFFEPLDFKGVATLPFSAFHGIRLDQGILLDSDHPDSGQFEAALKAAEAAAGRDDAFDPGEDSDPDFERRGRDKRFAALEAGCRALKTAMAEENDRAREQVFYTFELRAREHRFDRSAEPDKQGPLTLAGYRFSRAYGIITNYGTSISRPLIWLGKLTLGFAALNLLVLAIALFAGSVAAENWVWWAPDAPIHPSLTDTLGLAFKNALGPLRVLAGNGAAFDHLGDRAPIFTGLMLVSTLIQGLASSALIFLSLLALRRQFQIN
ncbi:hypothetical protein AWH62_03790 [Maricaulis sp. W15]|uniref:pentapeptide repeat-containing protein n=1 Tax=Maricaulis sp. W15 TaxID=1772333 RepID=UPI000948A419|nr:pentapeptide repeat-containing protein [Maricaulis sp. W15]OLF77804.1 hypothetical protein AWH62_03790 [Maricaulis sp. W15]